MTVIKNVEPYAVRQLRKDVRDAMMLAGEQSVLLQLFHSGDADAVPCPQCGDDIYNSPEQDCTSCYGTMFDGGVRVAQKVWAIYGDKEVSEQLGPRGTWQPDQREVTFETFPMITEHDILVRVQQWNPDSTIGLIGGFYILQKVQRRSLRTGNQYGQAAWDVVSQKAQCTELSSGEAIVRYPMLGKAWHEPSSLTVTTQAPVLPNEPLQYELAPGVDPS